MYDIVCYDYTGAPSPLIYTENRDVSRNSENCHALCIVHPCSLLIFNYYYRHLLLEWC